MIAKQVKGSDFTKALKYVGGKEGSRLIGTNMTGRNTRELADEFRIAHNLNYRVTKPVYHCSLSTHPDEKLSDKQWLNIAQDYLKGMDFHNNQYVVYRHHDTDHEHVHIIANRVGLDGKTVNDSWDYPRSEVVIEKIAQKYNLKQVNKEKKEKKVPKTGEMRRFRRTGEKPIRIQLQTAIDSLTGKGKMSLDELVEKLAQEQIEARISYNRGGEIRGISYKLDNVAFSGYQLGRGYTLNGLQKYKGVVTQLEINNTAHKRLEGNTQKTQIPNHLNEDDSSNKNLPLTMELVTEKAKKKDSLTDRKVRQTEHQQQQEFYHRKYLEYTEHELEK